MKRLFLAVVAMLSMNLAFAENEESNMMNVANVYDMDVNIRKLGETLGLSFDQMESVSDIHRVFCGEMMVASQSHKDDREKLVEQAVNKDLKYMSYILTPKQFDKYTILLNTTLNNRGLKEYTR